MNKLDESRTIQSSLEVLNAIEKNEYYDGKDEDSRKGK
jgi:hypothetical protein